MHAFADCNTTTFWRRKFIFAHPAGNTVKFAYECHRIKVLIRGWSCLRLEGILVTSTLIRRKCRQVNKNVHSSTKNARTQNFIMRLVWCIFKGRSVDINRLKLRTGRLSCLRCAGTCCRRKYLTTKRLRTIFTGDCKYNWKVPSGQTTREIRDE